MSGPAPNTTDPLAETAILSAVMVNPEAIHAALEYLPMESGEDIFSDRKCAAVWDAMLTCHEEGLPAEPMAIHERLSGDRHGVDMTFICGLLSAEVGTTSSHAPYYARRVAEAAGRRKALELSERYQSALKARDPEAGTVLQELQTLEGDPARSGLWRLDDIGDWLTTDPPDREWLFTDWLTTGIVGQLAAGGGSGKTWFVLLAGLSLATGRVLLPSLRPERARRVLAMLGEDDPQEIHRRIRLAAKGFGLLDADLSNLDLACGQARPLMAMRDGNAVPTQAFRELRRLIKSQQPELVILDSQARFYGLIENDNDAAALFITHLSTLCADYGCSVLLLHHVAKQTGQTRGATAFRDGCRWGAELHPLDEEEAKRHGIDQEELWRYLALSVTKSNYSRMGGEPLVLKRGEGGMLSETSLEGAGYQAIAEFVADYFETHDLRLTRYEIEKGGPGKQLRMDVAKTFHHCDRSMLVEVVQYAVDQNLLDAIQEQRGVNRTTVYCAMPSFD